MEVQAHRDSDAAVVMWNHWHSVRWRTALREPLVPMVHVAIAIRGHQQSALSRQNRAPPPPRRWHTHTTCCPAGSAAFDRALAARLAAIPPGLRKTGVDTGKRVPGAVLAWRANDGFASANPQPPPFLPSLLPGIWRRTVRAPTIFSKLGDVEPFGLLTSTQFLPVPPPQLESDEYAEAFNEVKEEGRRPATFPGDCLRTIIGRHYCGLAAPERHSPT